jgi:hypothetical protein
MAIEDEGTYSNSGTNSERPADECGLTRKRDGVDWRSSSAYLW